MGIIDAEEKEAQLDLDNVTDVYRNFRDGERIPVHTGLYVEDWNALETDDWDRTGQRGAFINLYGAEGINDMHLHELEPAGKTSGQCHLYEQIIYVAEGHGLTVVGHGDDEVIFEWQPHSLFFIPSNVPYRHVNTSDDTPARLISETPLPQLLTMFKDESHLWDVPDRSWRSIHQEYYSEEASVIESSHPDEPGGVLSWIANFVPDIQKFDKLQNHQARGAGGTSVIFPMPETSMWAHISDFPMGTYKKAHRHHPGANVCILSGEGFSLLWEEGWEDKVRIDWGPRSMFTPPARWYHQHFNTDTTRSRYFAMHGPKLGTLEETSMFDYRNPDNQIEYVDEDPSIRDHYDTELEHRGIESKMPAACYTDPDYEFES